MRTVGQILKETRQKKGQLLEDISQTTKIRIRFLEALENDNFAKLPSATSAKGFLKNYSEFLGLDSANILAVYRRDTLTENSLPPLPERLVQPVNQPKYNLSRLPVFILVPLIILGLAYYLGQQYFSTLKTPSLDIILPLEDKQTIDEKIDVVGKSDPDANVSVNENAVPVAFNGEFRYTLTLFKGENKIVIVAKSRGGQQTVKERTVYKIDNQTPP